MGEKKFACETCLWRRKSEEKPNTFWARIWIWHTKWCPGWKQYQKHLEEQGT